jgi:hypothetical protein
MENHRILSTSGDQEQGCSKGGDCSSAAEATNPEAMRDANKLLNDLDCVLQQFVPIKRRRDTKYTGRIPINRDKGTQKRFPHPNRRTLRHTMYLAWVCDTLNSFIIGTVATVRLLAFTLARNVKQHIVRYVLNLAALDQRYFGC